MVKRMKAYRIIASFRLKKTFKIEKSLPLRVEAQFAHSNAALEVMLSLWTSAKMCLNPLFKNIYGLFQVLQSRNFLVSKNQKLE